MSEDDYNMVCVQIHDSLFEGVRVSLPIPRRVDKMVEYEFLISKTVLKAPEGLQLLAPSSIASYRPSVDKRVRIRAVRPADFNRTDDPTAVLGQANLGKGMNYQRYIVERDRLFKAVDVLARPFARDVTRLTNEEKEVVKVWRDLFPKLREVPLEPYYEFSLGQFEAWINRATMVR